MKKIVVYLFVAVISITIVAFVPERSSSGAPASHTGAPGEKTCAVSGCHDDHAINLGNASLTIAIGVGETKYVPGQTYSIKIRIADKEVNRFGFQLVALDNKTNTNAGAFQIIDHERTQFMINEHVTALQNRNYVTYTFNGTDATLPGVGEWIVNWTAPATSVGPVTFYAGAVSANDDMSDKGDNVYTISKTLTN